MPATSSRPSEAEIEAFLTKLRIYRDTLPDAEQRLLNSMFFAAMGKQAEKDEGAHAYWVAYAPGYSFGGWYRSPWGGVYSTYYPRYW
jgi:hypothetical protein